MTLALLAIIVYPIKMICAIADTQKMLKDSKKRRGRPVTGQTPLMNIRVSMELRAAIEEWAKLQEDRPARSEAIRRLIEQSLKQGKR